MKDLPISALTGGISLLNYGVKLEISAKSIILDAHTFKKECARKLTYLMPV